MSARAGKLTIEDVAVPGMRGERLQRLNDQLGWILLVIVASSAIPLGSARPFFWALYAALAAAAALYYGIQLERRNAALRRLPIGIPTIVGFAAVCLVLLLQCLPLAPLAELAAAIVTAGGTTLAAPQVSLAPGNTLLMLVQLLSYGLIFALVLLVGANRHRRLRLLDGLFIVIVVHAGFAIVALTQLGDIVLIFPKWAYQGVATGTFVNRNSFATYLAMGLALGTGLTLDELVYRSRTDRLSRAKERGRPARSLVLHVVGLLIVMAGLLATQSRMGIAAGAVGALVVAVPLIIALPLSRAWRFVAGLLAIAAVAGLLSTFGQGFLERLGSLEASADVRMDLYRQVLEMIGARPWFGYGGGAFEVAFPLFHQLPVSPDLVWDKAHNTYLALWAELGVIAGTIPILLLLGFAVRLVAGSFNTVDRLAQLTALGALVAAGAHSFVDFSLEIEANTLLLLMLVALGLAAATSNTSSRPSGALAEK